jgi:hypothetical protein
MGLGSVITELGSRTRKKPIQDPGSMRQKGTGTWIPDTDPQHCCNANSICS